MTYNALLDGFFSSYWFSMALPLALIPVYYIFRPKIMKGKDGTFGEVCIVMGYAFVVMMTAGMANPLWWGFGTPEAVREIRYVDEKLLVIDHIRTMGSETDEGTPCSRVHVIDPETGEKQLRFTLGEEADLVGVHGDTLVVVKYNEATAYSLTDGHEYATYSQETLPDLFPELSSGIANIMWGGGSSIMEITANNGEMYELDLTTGWFYEATVENQEREMEVTEKLYCDDEEIKLDDVENGYYSPTKYSLDGIDGNQYALYFQDSHDSILNKQVSFLDGEFIGVNNKDSTCIILSYETLEHQEFILTCLSLDGKEVVWEIHQAQYNSEYNFTDYWKPHTGYNENTNQLTFWIEGDVYCVDAATGELLWQTTL